MIDKRISKYASKLLDNHMDHNVAVQKIAEKYGYKVKDVERILYLFFKIGVSSFVKKDMDVFIKNFGHYKKTKMKRFELLRIVEKERAIVKESNAAQQKRKKISTFVKNNKS
jgi:nucleoid DNA-binding protein